jgi:glycosyltransferase involved in cell wall biosynthesis
MPVDMRVFHAIDRRAARAKLGWKADGLYVLYVGRLEERKGLRELMQASRMLAPRLPNLHFVAVGSGPLATESASNTTFLGQVRYEDLPTYYNAADTCVLPSHGESWGRVVLESLACQTPVIATWTGCVPALVSENVEGIFTVPIRNSAALAEKISQSLSEAAALRNRIKGGKLLKYDSDNFVKQMLINYEELLA